LSRVANFHRRLREGHCADIAGRIIIGADTVGIGAVEPATDRRCGLPNGASRQLHGLHAIKRFQWTGAMVVPWTQRLSRPMRAVISTGHTPYTTEGLFDCTLTVTDENGNLMVAIEVVGVNSIRFGNLWGRSGQVRRSKGPIDARPVPISSDAIAKDRSDHSSLLASGPHAVVNGAANSF
jgi:hypothetical protein